MKIGFLSREYPPETGFGGIATFVYHLSQALAEAGHEVEVAAAAKERPQSGPVGRVTVHRVLPRHLEKSWVRLKMWLPTTASSLGYSLAMWEKMLERGRTKPFDIIDAPEHFAEGLWAALTKIYPLCLRLYTPYSLFVEQQFGGLEAHFDHVVMDIMEKFSLTGADAVTSPSLNLARLVAQDCRLDLEQIRLIPNPIDTEVFSPKKAEVKNEVVKVLFVGRLEERKGVHYLAEAVPKVLAQNPRVHFTFLGSDTFSGPGGTPMKEKLLEKIKGYETKVEFLSWVPLEVLPRYYSSADICVVPSLYDNSPYTCLEALACGRAVIATAAGGMAEYVEDGVSGKIIPAADTDALAEAISDLAAQEEKRRSFGQRARQRVLELYDKKIVAEQTLKLYQEAQTAFPRNRKNRLLHLDQSNFASSVENFFEQWEESLAAPLGKQQLQAGLYRLYYGLGRKIQGRVKHILRGE